MDIFDLSRKDSMPRDEIEVLDRQRHEFKLVGRTRKVPGHTLFSFNVRTGEIKAAPIERSRDVDFVTHGSASGDRLVIEPGCIYRQALNKKNFVRRLVREGILRKRTPTTKQQR